MCDCGCPTIYLGVDRDAGQPAAAYREAPFGPLTAQGHYPGDGATRYDVLLHQEEGWLTELELVPHEHDPPGEFPPAGELEVWTSEGPDAWWR